MIEETMNFYQYNLGIYPEEGIKFALAYLLKILKILLKYSLTKREKDSKLNQKRYHISKNWK